MKPDDPELMKQRARINYINNSICVSKNLELEEFVSAVREMLLWAAAREWEITDLAGMVHYCADNMPLINDAAESSKKILNNSEEKDNE